MLRLPSASVPTRPGRLFSIEDGSTFSAPHTFQWAVNSTHTVVWGTPQPSGPSIQYSFSGWADGGGPSFNPRVFTVGTSPATYLARFAATTLAAPPTAATGGVTAIESSSATLGGTVNPNGSPTTFYFQYGPNSLATFQTTQQQPVGSGTSTVPVIASVTGLTGDTTYYYRLLTFNTGGSSIGAVGTFRTLPQAPVVALSLDRSAIDFGIAPVGESRDQALVITNPPSSTGPLIGSVGPLSGAFALVAGGGSFTLQPGQSWIVATRFTPPSATSFSTLLSITHNAPGGQTQIPLSGAGQHLQWASQSIRIDPVQQRPDRHRSADPTDDQQSAGIDRHPQCDRERHVCALLRMLQPAAWDLAWDVGFCGR